MFNRAQECRQRLEEAVASDARVKSARTTMQERSAKFKVDTEEPGSIAKRRKLVDIESQAMVEEDSDRLATLFEEYRSTSNGRKLTTTTTESGGERTKPNAFWIAVASRIRGDEGWDMW